MAHLPPFPAIPNPQDPDEICLYINDMEAVLQAYEQRLEELLNPTPTISEE